MRDMEKENDIRLCNADCDKLHCARNKKCRFIHKNGGEDLKQINKSSLCENYQPKFKLSIEQKRQMYIERPFAIAQRRKELIKLIEQQKKQLSL